MKKSETQLLTRSSVILQLLLGSSLVFGQTKVITITIGDTQRPMQIALEQIEGLSGIPIHYEDMPVYHAADMKPTGVPAGQTPPPGVQLTIVPSGGQLSVPIVVDAATGRLKDIQAVETALLALVSAYNSSNLPGDFEVEQLNGVFFVKPVRYRDASGATQPMTPVLSTLITFPEEKRTREQTMRLILRQVSAAAGLEIGLGGMILWGEVTIGAQTEPARHVIARYLATLSGPAVTPPNATWDLGLSYLFLCQLQFGCVLNVVQVPGSPRWKIPPSEPYSPPPRQPFQGVPPAGRRTAP